MGVHLNVNEKGVGPKIVKIVSKVKENFNEKKTEEKKVAAENADKKPSQKKPAEYNDGWSIKNILEARNRQEAEEKKKKEEQKLERKRKQEKLRKDHVSVSLK